MPAANALTYLQLQNAVLGRRFPAASQRDNAKRWLATAYQDVWSAAEWSFARVSRANLALTTGDETPAMPSDFADDATVTKLLDDSGNEVRRFSQDDFEDFFSDTGSTGTAWAYMVVDRQITLYPTPGGDVTFRLSYRRRLSHKESDGTTVTGGFMDEDSDYPLWDDHHSVLIPRAVAIGLQEINDPTWQAPQDEYERQLARMVEDYETVNPAEQWGAVCWYA